jgi:hypothetical protein
MRGGCRVGIAERVVCKRGLRQDLQVRYGIRRFWVAVALALCVVPTASADDSRSKARSAVVSITKENYAGWPNTYRLDNGVIEARVVTDIGPRIIDFRLSGAANLLYVRDNEAGRSGESEWTFRGGWRLWLAPERRETTYALDNAPCEVEVLDGTTLRVSGPAQVDVGIQKIVEVAVPAGEPRVHIRSRIRNVSSAPLTYAAWSLAVLRPGGRAFVPLDVGSLTAFDATRKLILWSYTEFDDPRYRFADRLVEIDHARVREPPAGQAGRRDDESKIGVDSAQGWAAYLLEGTLFLKRFSHDAAGTYPDGGSTIEVYSSHEFLELEHLGPLTTVAPGEEIVFAEDWWLFGDVAVPEQSADVLPVLQGFLKRAPLP